MESSRQNRPKKPFPDYFVGKRWLPNELIMDIEDMRRQPIKEIGEKLVQNTKGMPSAYATLSEPFLFGVPTFRRNHAKEGFAANMFRFIDTEDGVRPVLHSMVERRLEPGTRVNLGERSTPFGFDN